MTDNFNFIPRRVIAPNDQKDENSDLCIRGLLVDSQAIAHDIKCMDVFDKMMLNSCSNGMT